MGRTQWLIHGIDALWIATAASTWCSYLMSLLMAVHGFLVRKHIFQIPGNVKIVALFEFKVEFELRTWLASQAARALPAAGNYAYTGFLHCCSFRCALARGLARKAMAWALNSWRLSATKPSHMNHHVSKRQFYAHGRSPSASRS